MTFLIDTSQDKFNQEKVRELRTLENLWKKEGRKKTSEFLTDPEVKIDLIYIERISRGEAKKRSTFAKYLE